MIRSTAEISPFDIPSSCARLDTGEVGGVMGEIARRPEFAVADVVDGGLDLFLDRLGDGRRDLGGDHHRVGDFGAR